MIESEHLVRLILKDGKHIDFHRDDDNTVRICEENDFCVVMPDATGKLTSELFALLEPFAEKVISEDSDE